MEFVGFSQMKRGCIMSIDFDEIINRKNTSSLKWDFNFENDGVLPMSIADMDFHSPKVVEEAIIKRAKHGLYGYVGVSETFKEAVKGWVNKRHEWKIHEDWILFSSTVTASIRNVIPAFTEEEDKILILTPCYGSFSYSIFLNKREVVTCPLVFQNNYYTIDFADLEKKLSDGVKMFVLCNPHNPVGRIWTLDELTRIGNLCVRYNVLLVSDEIHSDIVFAGYKHKPISSISTEIANNTITFMSAGKTFNLSGLSASYIIVPNEEIRNKFKKQLKLTGVHEPSIFGLIATETVYLYGEYWLENTLSYLQKNYDYLVKYCEEKIPEIKVTKQEGTYLAWLDCRKLGIDANKLKEFFNNQAKVKLNDGLSFGKDGAGFQRLNFACPNAILLEGLKRIELAVNKNSTHL